MRKVRCELCNKEIPEDEAYSFIVGDLLIQDEVYCAECAEGILRFMSSATEDIEPVNINV